MPVHFSPSRSLKYCRITLRTVSVSSLSRESERSDLCLGCKGDLAFIVFEGARVRELRVEEFLHGGELRLGGFKRVHAGAEDGGVLEPLGVPADVLAGHARAALVAIEGIEVVKMRQEHFLDLRHFGRRQVRAGLEEVRDL